MGPIFQSFIAVVSNIYRFFQNFQTQNTGHILDLIELYKIGIDSWIGEANSQRLIVSENELYICIFTRSIIYPRSLYMHLVLNINGGT